MEAIDHHPCPLCGALILCSGADCPHCENPSPDALPSQPLQTNAESSPNPVLRLLTCRDCGSKVSASARACPHCAAVLPAWGTFQFGLRSFAIAIVKFVIGTAICIWLIKWLSTTDIARLLQ